MISLSGNYIKMRNITNNQFIVLVFMLLVVALRVIMPTTEAFTMIAAYTPIGAMALFGGAYFKGLKKFIFPLVTLWISDIFINRFLYFGEWVLFYEGFFWTYGAFALMVIAGHCLLQKVNLRNFLSSALLITFIHWIVTDLGVFIGSGMYPHTWSGWWLCLTAAIPFEQNFLTGTLLYGGVMFAIYQWMIAGKTSFMIR